MRGKGNLSGPFYSRSGITPACAGKRVRQHRRAGGKRDHPRVCGEKWYNAAQSWQQMGSPPRVRGKVFTFAHVNVYERITPACAGKSELSSALPVSWRDHPRVCGEKLSAVGAGKRGAGSPPRVRGKGAGSCGQRMRQGITPACAGKSLWWPPAGGRAQDHPRVCGEKSLAFLHFWR